MLDYSIFAKRMYELRKERNLTMEEAGKEIGVTKVSIHGYENENRKPSMDTLLSIARYYGVSIDYLFGKDVETDKGMISREEYQFLEMVRQTPKLRKKLCDEPKRVYELLVKKFGGNKWTR